MSKLRIAGWIMSVLFSAFLIFPSATFKLLPSEEMQEAFVESGYGVETMRNIGIVEVSIAILFLIPHTSFVAAILLSAYLGGAVNTHVHGGEPFFFPILMGVFMWVAYGFRRPGIFKLAIGKPIEAATKSPAEG